MSGAASVGMWFERYAARLPSSLVRLANEAVSSHQDRRYPDAATRAGACLEGLLDLVLRGWGCQIAERATLGPLIGSLRQSGRAPAELLERLNEANTIRNRAPHHKPHPLSRITEGDSLQILNILALLVEWWMAQPPVAAETDPIADLLPVFLSLGGPHRLDQLQFVRHLRTAMRDLGVDLRQLMPGQYSEQRPFDQIRQVMSSCVGALVVGLERSHAYTVFEREDSEQERLRQDQYIPTPWNQIEGGMAAALRLPILVMRERRLSVEGVFEASNHRHVILDFDLAAESKGLSPDLSGVLEGWVASIRPTAADGGRPEPAPPRRPSGD